MPWKVLIANRGEVALRILKACRLLGYNSIVCHSEPDRTSLAVRLADEHLCIGPAAAMESYLNIPQILRAAELSGANAIHPGYGFLSENASFAEQVTAAGFTFIGPSAAHIKLMGDKHQALVTARDFGFNIVPGSHGLISADLNQALSTAQQIGYPLLIKASSGGGGKGIKIVHSAQEFVDYMPVMQTEVARAYGNADLYLEKYLCEPRHIEVQILGDGVGGAWHFGLRDCSVQRRHQKVIEEAWPIGLDPTATKDILDKSCAFIKAMQYKGLGTLEFLYSDGQYFFMEMNTRLQVEHPITEMITGWDLVMLQMQIFNPSHHFSLQQSDIVFNGHAIECRINAEDPTTFIPCAGRVSFYHPPGGFGVRVESALYHGSVVPPYYDSMIAKIITHGRTREQALCKMRLALEECVIEGLKTNLAFHMSVLSSPEFVSGHYTTCLLKQLGYHHS